MNIKKAVTAGLLVFAVQFTTVSVLGNTIGPFLGTSTTAGYAWQVLMVLILVAIVYCASRWYFAGNSVSTRKGAYLGLLFVVTSLVINLFQTIPPLVAGQNILSPLLQYVTSLPFLMTVAITVVTTAVAGYLGTKRSASKIKEAVAACMPTDTVVAAKEK